MIKTSPSVARSSDQDGRVPNKALTVQCCVCFKIRKGASWVTRVEAIIGLCSHGYCPDCYHRLLNELEQELADVPRT
jgi:hypothetical protein